MYRIHNVWLQVCGWHSGLCTSAQLSSSPYGHQSMLLQNHLWLHFVSLYFSAKPVVLNVSYIRYHVLPQCLLMVTII